jgi:threonine dehydrogenase-like Zn-dependent dehydrogenase
MELAVRMVGEIAPSKYITAEFPLEESKEAFELIDSKPESCIQILLKP